MYVSFDESFFYYYLVQVSELFFSASSGSFINAFLYTRISIEICLRIRRIFQRFSLKILSVATKKKFQRNVYITDKERVCDYFRVVGSNNECDEKLLAPDEEDLSVETAIGVLNIVVDEGLVGVVENPLQAAPIDDCVACGLPIADVPNPKRLDGENTVEFRSDCTYLFMSVEIVTNP